MRTDIESQLKSCPACRRWTITKVGYHPLTPITSEHPMDVIAMDTAKSFPTSPRGNNVLLIAICVFTRFIFLRPLQDNSALAVSSALFSIFTNFGFPRVIQSDNGTEFVNAIVRHLTTSFISITDYLHRITQGLMAWQSALFRPHVALFVNSGR
ncbi:hypothetical protein BASA61_010340 [Batrachochytrium salamandrivorans]|nr:hypothetical protein BASA61_010340 [Batrachochytrium salamandrivorans]